MRQNKQTVRQHLLVFAAILAVAGAPTQGRADAALNYEGLADVKVSTLDHAQGQGVKDKPDFSGPAFGKDLRNCGEEPDLSLENLLTIGGGEGQRILPPRLEAFGIAFGEGLLGHAFQEAEIRVGQVFDRLGLPFRDVGQQIRRFRGRLIGRMENGGDTSFGEP